MAIKPLRISIIGDSNKAVRSIEKLQTKMDGLRRSIIRPLAIGGLAVGVAQFGQLATRGLKGAILAASNLNESLTTAKVLFGSGFADLDKFSRKGADALGLSRTEALKAAAGFGSFGNTAGLSGKKLAKFSSNLTRLAVDLASFRNTSVEQALGAVQSGLAGEAEPLRKYGVLLNEANVRQEGFRIGLVKTQKKLLTPQQRVLAVTSLIYRQTLKAQGDFVRTSQGQANLLRTLQGTFQDVAATLGQKFLPASRAATKQAIAFLKGIMSGTGVGGQFAHLFNKLVSFLTGTFIPALTRAVGFTLRFFQAFADNRGNAGKFRRVIGVIVSLVKNILVPTLGLAASLIGGLFGGLTGGGLKTGALTGSIENIGKTLRGLQDDASRVGTKVGNVLRRAGQFILKIVRAIGPTISAMFGAVVSGGRKVASFFKTTVGPLLKRAFIAGIEGAKRLANFFTTSVVPVIKRVFAAGIAGAKRLAGFFKAQVVPVLKRVFTAGIDGAKRLASFFVTSVVPVLRRGFDAGIAGAKRLAVFFRDNVVPVVQRAAGAVGRAIGRIITALAGLASQAKQQLPGVKSAIGDGLVKAFSGIKNAAAASVGPIKDFVKRTAGQLVDGFARIKPQIQELAGTFVKIFAAIGGGGRAAGGLNSFADVLGFIANNAVPVAITVLSTFLEILNNPTFQVAAGLLLAYAAALKIVTTAVTIATAVGKVFAAGQAVVNLVLSANPIALIIIAIAAFIAGIVLLYRKNEKFREVVQIVWAAVKQAVSVGVGFIVRVFRVIGPILTAPFRLMVRVVRAVIGFVARNWGVIKNLLLGPVGFVVTNLFKYRSRIVGIFVGIASTVRRVFRAIGSTIVNALKSAVNTAIDLVNLPIRSINGIAGQVGIPSLPEIPKLAKGGIVNRATLAVVGEAGPEAVIPLRKLGSLGSTYNISVQAGVGDPAEIGRQVVALIQAHERNTGRRAF